MGLAEDSINVPVVVNDTEEKIENLIHVVRGEQVMLDSDLAFLYNIETKKFNQAVKRNKKRFPENFMFQLNEKEYTNLRSQIVTSSSKNNYGGRRYLPYVFTEQGIAMLSAILKSEEAIETSIKIIDTFVAMRKYISNNFIEQRYMYNQVMRNVEDIAENKKNIKLLQQSFEKLDSKKLINEIYFKGQIYDAYSKIKEIFKYTKKELIIIDNYADYTTLDIIKNIKCIVILIVKNNSKLSKLDIDKYNKQYHNLKIIYNDNYHDRYFIIDRNIIYHCGTSINHAGSKTFSINILEDKIVKDNLIKDIIKSCKLNNNEL